MTTTIHVLNFGPNPVKVSGVNLENGQPTDTPTVLYPQQSKNIYVYDTQSIIVKEEVEQKSS